MKIVKESIISLDDNTEAYSFIVVELFRIKTFEEVKGN